MSDGQVTIEMVVILDVCRSFIWNKTTFTKYCLIQWISKLPGALKFTEKDSNYSISRVWPA